MKMKIEEAKIKRLRITDVTGLDPITVYLEDFEPRKGKITIECYGESWSSYWGGMGDQTIQEFFMNGYEDYLAGNLSNVTPRTVDDKEAFIQETKKNLLKSRREEELDEFDARDLYDWLQDFDLEDNIHLYHEEFGKILGDDWWCSIPQKENYKYAYLCKIINTVQEALKVNSTKEASNV